MKKSVRLFSLLLSVIICLQIVSKNEIYVSASSLDYSAVYDHDYYINNNPDIKKAYSNDRVAALQHFLVWGMKEGRRANNTFDVNSYKNANGDLRKAFGNDLKKYYVHYINFGIYEPGRKTTGVHQLININTTLDGVDYSPVYDYEYYINNNSDVKRAYQNDDYAVLKHFVIFGIAEGRQGNANFDVISYKLANQDLRLSFSDDLKKYVIHYIKYGRYESNRRTIGVNQIVNPITKYKDIDYSAVYDYEYYIKNNLDIAKAYPNDDGKVLQHFLVWGMNETHRLTSPLFNINYYKGNYADLQNAYGNNYKSYYMHYIKTGKSEGRNATQQIHNYQKTNSISYQIEYTCSICGDKQYIPNTSYNGWILEGGKKYYIQSGKKVTGWQTILGRKYRFNASGALETSIGIDVSSHQGTINWQEVKNDGIEYAIIRVGYGENLKDQDDSKAIYNMAECERLGIPYGVYIYSYALSEKQAYSEVDHTLRMLQGRNPTLGVFYDVEDTDYYRRHGFDPYQNKDKLTQFCKIFTSSMKNKGYKTGIYANLEYLKNIIDVNSFSHDIVWLAQYYTIPTYEGKWDIWQYTSSGSVKGVSGNVDMNVRLNR